MGVVQIEYLDVGASVTPPNGHLEPLPVTLGPSQQYNDVRIAFFVGGGTTTTLNAMIPMNPDPPSGFTAAFNLNPGHETWGAYFNRIAPGDVDASVAFIKPAGWLYFASAFLTARGVDPTWAPTGGRLQLTYTTGDTTAFVSPVTVPSAGDMLFFISTCSDPYGGWPDWPSSLGCPIDWDNVVATDKSGQTYYEYDTNPAALVIGKRFTSAGSTGTVSIPCTQGRPGFAGSWMFLKPAADVPATLGAV
jgi:hypothetical protein